MVDTWWQDSEKMKQNSTILGEEEGLGSLPWLCFSTAMYYQISDEKKHQKYNKQKWIIMDPCKYIDKKGSEQKDQINEQDILYHQVK